MKLIIFLLLVSFSSVAQTVTFDSVYTATTTDSIRYTASLPKHSTLTVSKDRKTVILNGDTLTFNGVNYSGADVNFFGSYNPLSYVVGIEREHSVTFYSNGWFNDIMFCEKIRPK